MKTILPILFLLLASASAHATACDSTSNGCVQYATGDFVTSGSTSASLTGVGTHHEIIAFVLSYPGTSFSLSSSLGLSYTERQQVDTAPMMGDYCEGCIITALTAETGASSGNETVTVTITGMTMVLGPIELFEYQGFTGATPYDASGFFQASGEGDGTYDSSSFVTSQPGDVLVGLAYNPRRAADCPIGPIVDWTAPAGYALTTPSFVTSDMCGGFNSEDTVFTGSGTTTGSWTVTTGNFIGAFVFLAFTASGFATQIGGFAVGP